MTIAIVAPRGDARGQGLMELRHRVSLANAPDNCQS